MNIAPLVTERGGAPSDDDLRAAAAHGHTVRTPANEHPVAVHSVNWNTTEETY